MWVAGCRAKEVGRVEPHVWRGVREGFRKVDVRLPGKGNPNSHGARPVHLIITIVKCIRTSRLSIKNSLYRQSLERVCLERLLGKVWRGFTGEGFGAVQSSWVESIHIWFKVEGQGFRAEDSERV